MNPDVPPLPQGVDAQPSTQQRAVRTHRRLSSFAHRLEQGIARPGELTRIFMQGGGADPNQACFARMARQAVRRKYALAGRLGVVRCLDTYEQAVQSSSSAADSDRARAIVHTLLGGRWVRLAQHATRRRCADTDLFACPESYLYLTPWIFQCPDLRYRVHEATWSRLRFVLACWAHYAEHGITPASMGFGLDAFPLGPDLRPDIAGPPV